MEKGKIGVSELRNP